MTPEPVRLAGPAPDLLGWRVARAVQAGLGPLWQRAYRCCGVRDNVTLGRDVRLGVGTVLWAPRRLVIGDGVYVGRYSTIEVDGVIGGGTLIANHVGIVGRRDHDVRRVGVPARFAPWVGDDPDRLSTPVDIGADVWIGYGAVVLGGVRIGPGAVVAAGSLVVDPVPCYAVVAGDPARVVGTWFDEAAPMHETLLGQRAGRAPA
ncbi:MAG TPA: acyltransferase [Mycobacteriales bacterium]|nr:acyltransferase [Mycobacteriales bacterium]